MADIHDKKTRSYNMSRVRGKDTKPELIVRRFLHGQGYRYRLHDKKFPGKPDIVLKKYRTVIFINGCFWHGHEGCKYYSIPKTRTEFWLNKIKTNQKNDIRNKELLLQKDWKVITIWECELKRMKRQKTLNKVTEELTI